MPAVDQLARQWIDYAETISAFVRGRAIFIQPWGHSRRTAQRNKDSPPVGRCMNAARPFTHRKSSNNAVSGSINYRDVARAFVAYEHEIAGRFTARHAEEKNPNDRRDTQAMHGVTRTSQCPWVQLGAQNFNIGCSISDVGCLLHASARQTFHSRSS